MRMAARAWGILNKKFSYYLLTGTAAIVVLGTSNLITENKKLGYLQISASQRARPQVTISILIHTYIGCYDYVSHEKFDPLTICNCI